MRRPLGREEEEAPEAEPKVNWRVSLGSVIYFFNLISLLNTVPVAPLSNRTCGSTKLSSSTVTVRPFSNQVHPGA
jgi:hypothetical protein